MEMILWKGGEVDSIKSMQVEVVVCGVEVDTWIKPPIN